MIGDLKRIAAWAVFGARFFHRMEEGFMFTDLHRGNILEGFGHSGEYRVVNVDHGALRKIVLPDDWRLAVAVLGGLFAWPDEDALAALRFGFANFGGPLGELITRTIERDLDLRPLAESPTALAADDDENRAIALYGSWRARRIAESPPNQDSPQRLYQIEDLETWRGVTDPTTSMIAEYWCRRHLVAAMYAESVMGLFEGVLNLAAFHRVRGSEVMTYALAAYCEELARVTRNVPSDLKQFVSSITAAIPLPSPAVRAAVVGVPFFVNIFRYVWAIERIASASVGRNG